jgi:hypothetical protein
MTVWALAASFTALPADAQSTQTLRALLMEYRCPVVDRLDRIYEFPKPTDYKDRFLAVMLVGHPHGYVQCMFVANRSRIFCEASSGFYFNKPGTARTFYLPQAAIAALGRLGFSTDDSAGNFRYEAAIGGPAEFQCHRRPYLEGAA